MANEMLDTVQRYSGVKFSLESALDGALTVSAAKDGCRVVFECRVEEFYPTDDADKQLAGVVEACARKLTERLVEKWQNS